MICVKYTEFKNVATNFSVDCFKNQYFITDNTVKAFCQVVFPPGESRREISQEIWGFEIFRFPGNLCRDPGKVVYDTYSIIPT